MWLRIAYCRRPVSCLHCRILQLGEAVRRKSLNLSKPPEAQAAAPDLAQPMDAERPHVNQLLRHFASDVVDADVEGPKHGQTGQRNRAHDDQAVFVQVRYLQCGQPAELGRNRVVSSQSCACKIFRFPKDSGVGPFSLPPREFQVEAGY